ncbi:zinc transporter ZIP3-like [Culicoides brevitarsis]|uniref:zinc transporter ZIP3-like n=1 Tax=Culicoides brevitarsis TaxID=469753 RepID=UPI00307C2513
MSSIALSSHPHKSDDENHHIIVAKVTAMAVLFSVSTLCGLAPFKLSQWFHWSQKDTKSSGIVMPMLLSFGGGVLLSTTFCHLLPDVHENVRNLTERGLLPHLKFDLAPLLMAGGFFMVYFIEETVHWYMHRREHRMEKADAEEAFKRGRSTRNSICNGANGKENLENGTEPITINVMEALPVIHEKHQHTHLPQDEDSFQANMRGLLIVLALSIHELFEGLAVGLESSSSTVWYMFGAVSAHKYVIAFCIGVELVVNKTKTWLGITYILIYSFVSALGIGIGIILVNGTNADDMEVPSAILQGLAAGTLLFVVFFEILCKDKSGLPQFLAVLVGFGTIFAIQVLTEPKMETPILKVGQ